jgi:ankyrin repeat protein
VSILYQQKAFIRLKEEIEKSSGPHLQEHVGFLNEKALMQAVEEGREAVVSRMCDIGANIACIDNRRRSPLHIAAEKGYIGIVRLLLKHGADTDSKSDLNWTPAMAAAHEGQYAVVELIRVHAIAKKHIPSSISTEYCSQVILFLDSDWGSFFLDTLNAKIQLAGEVPDGVIRHKDYHLRLGHADMLFEEIEIYFSILHRDPFLAFTVDFGYGGTKGGQRGYIKVTIVNGETYEVHRDPFKIANTTSFENVPTSFAMEAADSRP